jgi:hypothetical protein
MADLGVCSRAGAGRVSARPSFAPVSSREGPVRSIALIAGAGIVDAEFYSRLRQDDPDQKRARPTFTKARHRMKDGQPTLGKLLRGLRDRNRWTLK